MLPQRLDTLLAFKAISLSELTGTDKQVAAAIIDSFNRRTQQCDPSFDRIAHLVCKSRRTIIRAVQRLERMRFIIKVRHGGHFHRNSYEPNWAHFRQLEAQWKARRATRHWMTDVSPSMVPTPCHGGGDKTDTQTILTNHSKATCPPSPPGTDRNLREAEGRKWHPKEERSSPSPESGRTLRCRSIKGAVFNDAKFAARSSAERRWNSALLKRLIDTPDLYARAVEAIDVELQNAATEAEMKRTGGGLSHIIEQLVRQGLKL